MNFILTNSVAFLQSFTKYSINTPLRIAHFLAQAAHESADFTDFTESLNYTPQGLIDTFGTSRISVAQANLYGRTAQHKANQEAIANIVYGGEWGRKNLGNIYQGDGWRFRGRGIFQLTGRSNYEAYRKYSGVDVVSNPDLVATINIAIDTAGFYWHNRGLNPLADNNQIEALTKKINAKSLGLDKRKQKLAFYKTQNLSIELLKKKIKALRLSNPFYNPFTRFLFGD